MEQLLQATAAALTADEAATRDVHQRTELADALRLLREHEPALVKAYPMALLEIFAEGPAPAKAMPATATGMDFGELSLMDDAQVQAQVEFSRAQQLAVHATDATLAELNTLVSAAQGLRSVQPERNPLRPDNYIRALQQVVGETGVSGAVRQVWMRHLRDPLGRLLTEEYERTAKALREQGVQPVGYAVAAGPGMARHSQQGGGYAASQQGGGYGTGYGHSMAADLAVTGYSRSGAMTGWGSGYSPAAEAEEALLTVGMLRQMLASQPMDPHRVAVSAQGALAAQQPSLQGGVYAQQAMVASEAMEDIAELERIVGRLAQAHPAQSSQAAPLAAWPGVGVQAVPVLAPGMVYAVPSGAPAADPGMAAQEVVSRMVAHLVQDARLLPSVQRAVRSLEPALQQLVRHDPVFFNDEAHPARRLLDEVTERSRSFASEDATGFSRFMRVVNEAVVHLSGQNIQDAAPFASVLTALETAWEAQARKERAQREAKAQALRQVEQRAKLAAQIAQGIGKLADTGQVPADIVDFATGPWAEVAAWAQIHAPAEDDPGGYLALVPELFWSVQPGQVGSDAQRLAAALPGMRETLRHGLLGIGRSEEHVQSFLARLQERHDEVLALAQAAAMAAVEEQAPPAEAEAPPQHVDIDLDMDAGAPVQPVAQATVAFGIGDWFELVSQRRAVRTQLTWASPHQTLFLFTAPDGSTQSMTRRMCDKLMAEGSLRALPPKG